MVKRTRKAKKPIEPVKEEMSLKILQPEKFKKIIIIAVCFLFLMVIVFFFLELNSVPEEAVSQTTGIISPENATAISSDGSIFSGDIFGFSPIFIMILIISWFVWRTIFRRSSIF